MSTAWKSNHPISVDQGMHSTKCCMLSNMQLLIMKNLFMFWCADWYSARKFVIHHPGFWAECSFIIAAASKIQVQCAQKPGWWITNFHAEHPATHLTEWRFFFTKSCILLNKHSFAEWISGSNDVGQRSLETIGIFYWFCKFLNVQNLITTVEVVEIALWRLRLHSQLQRQIVGVLKGIHSWDVCTCCNHWKDRDGYGDQAF